MDEHQELLDEARRFCDPATGEVVERIPEELMKELRTAMLARGIPGRPSQRTGSSATWFVFLDEEIRERVLAEWRKANEAQRRGRAKPVQGESTTDSSPAEERPVPGQPAIEASGRSGGSEETR